MARCTNHLHDEAIPEADSGEPELKELGRVPDWLWENPESIGEDNIAVYTFAPIYVPDGRVFIASGGGDEKVRILEVGAAETEIHMRHEFAIHADSITKCVTSFDNKYLAAASLDGKISIYNLSVISSESEFHVDHLRTFDEPTGEIEDCVWSPKGHTLLATSADGIAWLWHATRGFHGTLVGHNGAIVRGAFQQHDEVIIVVTASLDGFVIFWEPIGCTAVHKVRLSGASDHDDNVPVTSMSVHSSEPLVVVGTADGFLHMLQSVTGHHIWKLSLFESQVTDVVFAPVSTRQEMGDAVIAAADNAGVIKVIDASSSRIRHVLEHEASVTHLCWTPVWPPVLISGGDDGTLRMWDIRSGNIVDKLACTPSMITDMRIFPVANPPLLLIGVALEEGEISVWHLS